MWGGQNKKDDKEKDLFSQDTYTTTSFFLHDLLVSYDRYRMIT